MTIRAPFLTTVLLCLLASACTSWKLATPNAPPMDPFQPPAAERAQVCVVRSSPMAAAVTFVVRDNGVLVGATRGRGYFCYYAQPGMHDILIDTSDASESAKLVAEPGGRYYLKQEVDNILGFVRCRGVWLAEDLARQEISRVPYRMLMGVPGNEQLPRAVAFAPAKSTQQASAR